MTGSRQQQDAAKCRHRNRLAVMAAVVAIIVGVGVFLAVRPGSTTNPSGTRGSSAAAGQVSLGAPAPDGVFTTLAGRQMSVADLRGKPTLLWFVTTWCSSCQAGTQVVAQHVDQLRAHGVRVVEVMLSDNLGQTGPSMRDFAAKFAGSAQGSDWLFGTASQELTAGYDPGAYLDIYYLLDRNGTVRYVNGSPAATLTDLITHTENLT